MGRRIATGQTLNSWSQMVTMARRAVRAAGGIGIVELVLCPGVRGMGLGTASTVLARTRLTVNAAMLTR